MIMFGVLVWIVSVVVLGAAVRGVVALWQDTRDRRRTVVRWSRGLWWSARRGWRLGSGLAWSRVRFAGRRWWLSVRYSARAERVAREVLGSTPGAPNWGARWLEYAVGTWHGIDLWLHFKRLDGQAWVVRQPVCQWLGGVCWVMGPELADTVREVAGMVRTRRFALAV